MNYDIIKIDEIISSNSASTPESGDKLYNELKNKIDSIKNEVNDYTLIVDFTKITNITSAFLNNAIGKLFNYYPENLLIKLLKFRGVKTIDDFNIIKLTINNAIMMSKYEKTL